MLHKLAKYYREIAAQFREGGDREKAEEYDQKAAECDSVNEWNASDAEQA